MNLEIDINEDYEDVKVVIKSPRMDEKVTLLIEKLKKEDKPNTLTGKVGEKIYILNLAEVYLFYSQTGKVYADIRERSMEINKTLYALEEELKHTDFIRISKSAIVNIRRIKNIEVSFNGCLVVKFPNGHEEIISRRYAAKVKEFIGLGGKK